MLKALLPCNAAGSVRSRIYVYRGEGAGWRSVRSTFESLQRLLPVQYEVSTLTAAQLLNGSWTSEAALLVMPGGADMPYCNSLNGRGNRIITGYVHSGGSYLGLCAGAYYACSRVEFEEGSRLQVVGDRELSFFPGIACGAAFPGFDYQTEAGAVAASVQFAVPPKLAQQLQQQGSLLLQRSSSNGSSWCSTCDYCNGGPFFMTRDRQLDVSALPGVQVLANYCLPGRRDLELNRQSQQQQQQQQQPQQPHQPQHPEQTSNETAVVQAAAAVRCNVGSGVAVLCGTHPELEPRWLDVSGWSSKRPRSASTAAEEGSTPPAAHCNGSSALPQPALVLHAYMAAGHCAMPQQQSQQAMPNVPNASSSASMEAGSAASGVCEDVQLANHMQALQRVLAASQEQRDLFLSCLLYELLARP